MVRLQRNKVAINRWVRNLLNKSRNLAEPTLLRDQLSPELRDKLIIDVATGKSWEEIHSLPKTEPVVLRAYSSSIRFVEGFHHALHLSKSIVMPGVPASVLNNFDRYSISDQIVQRSVMQTARWFPANDPLPRRWEASRPYHRFVRPRGLRQTIAVPMLWENWFALACSCVEQPGYVMKNIHVHRNHAISVPFVFRDKEKVVMNITAPVYVTSTRSIPAFSEGSDVRDTESGGFPDIFPISPLLDLIPRTQSEIMTDPRFCSGWANEEAAIDYQPHSVFLTDEKRQPQVDTWTRPDAVPATDGERQGRALMHAFGFAMAHAIASGNPLGTMRLNSPVCLNVFHSDGSSFGFLSFQLNTLDFSSESGVKNQVWFDGCHRLFAQTYADEDSSVPDIVDYDREIFRRFLAHLTHSHPYL